MSFNLYFLGMAIYTVEELQEFYDAAKSAYKQALKSQSYSIGGRSLTRANVEELKRDVDYWAGELAKAKAGTSGGIRMIRCVPHG